MICAITVTVIGSIISEEVNKTGEADLIEIFAKTSLIILTVVLVAYFLRDVFIAIILEEVQGYAIQGMASRQLSMEAPRPTGLARSAAILSLVCVIMYGSEKYRHKALYYAGCFFLALVIFYQARGTISALVVTTIVVLLCLPKSKIPQPIEILKFLILSVVFFLGIIAFLYSSIYVATFAKAIFLQISNLSPIYGFTFPMTNTQPLFRELPISDFSSGRLGIWESAIELAKKSPFFGFGSQADRLYLNKNASNIVIYSLICGGVVSLIFGGLCLSKTMTNIWFSVTRKLADEQGFYDYRTLCAIAVFTFLSSRGIFENSYSLFSIDFLLAVPAIWHLNLSLFTERKN